MSARRNKAFTLTEMLVVIAIIGVLVSILLPAVQAARESARRAVCQKNIGQCAMGIITYDARKGFLPAARTYYPSAGIIQNWVVPVLPMIDRQDLSDTIRNNGGNPTSVVGETIPVLVCPSDPESSPIRSPGALSYRVNGGRQNFRADNFDYLANGLFVDRGHPSPPAVQDRMSLDRVRDGVSTTIMLAENLILLADNDGLASNALLWPSVGWTRWALAPYQEDAEVLWWPDCESCPVKHSTYCPDCTGPMSSQMVDRYQALNHAWTPLEPGQPPSRVRYARPMSAHVNGFHVAFCDGSVRFMADSVDYKIYAVLLTSCGDQARNPWQHLVSRPKDDDATWQSVLRNSAAPGSYIYPGTKF